MPKLPAIPPIKKPGFKPFCSKIHVNMPVVVVFPCVPETANTQRSRNK